MDLKNVKKILEENGLYKLPVDIEKLASKLGIDVVFKSLKDSVSGILITTKSNQSVIVINDGHHPNRQRFSIAHELSHYLLHKNSADVFVDDFQAYFRDEKSSTGELKKEREANQLAAEILMPKELVNNEIDSHKIDLHDAGRINDLATKFAVSNEAMLLRLKKLDYLIDY